MKVVDFLYVRNEKKKIFLKSEGTDYYLRHGWQIVKDFSEEGYCIINKPAQALLRILDDDGIIKNVDCKDTILRVYRKKKISQSMLIRFYEEAKKGVWILSFDRYNNLLAFKNGQTSLF